MLQKLCNLIKLAATIFHMLQADQLVVQGMMASRYLAQFEEVVSGWQTQLSMVRYKMSQFFQDGLLICLRL